MYPPAQTQTRAVELCDKFHLNHTTTADEVDILTVNRSEISWIQDNYDKMMAGAICRKCGKTTGPFELDHMSPWRPYVIALLGPNEARPSGSKLLVSKTIVRVLYNDPENLWCLCRSCNREKSDKVYSIEQAIAISKGQDPTGEMTRIRKEKELAAWWE